MKIEDYKKALKFPLKDRTLCFLIDNNRILLGMKKRGFGQGKYVGIGGKVEENERIEDAAIREVKEEIGVTLKDIERVASLNFYFPYVEKPEFWNQRVYVFISKSWNDNITETEEILPQWFTVYKIPFETMWDDYNYWLLDMLNGKKLNAEFLFNREFKVEDWSITYH